MSQSLIAIDDARQLVLRAARPLGTESVPIEQALDRVLAQDVVAAGEVPPFPCSAMDGYALRAGPAGRTLSVIGESRAGAPYDSTVGDGQAVRISTGAAVPAGATAVLRQEDVQREGERIKASAVTAEGENVRVRGEDMRAGTTVLHAGTRLGAAELGAAVAAGAGSVEVARRPRVTVLCTGDELRAPGEPLGPGQIHNSNAPMLAALAAHSGAVANGSSRLPDDRAATEEALGEALERSDLVVVSGGVSVGPHDHVKPALQALGVQEVFWGVALQPGKPTWFGTRQDKLVFGLPGNPVSAVVTFSLFARPALLALQGERSARGWAHHAQLAVAVRRNPAREQALRVRLEHRDGALLATPNGPQASHMVTSLLGADALALIPRGEGELPPGSQVVLEELPG